MSTLSLHDLQGFSTYSNTVRVPSGHTFQVDGRLKIPQGTTSNRPGSPANGELYYNTTIGQLETYIQDGWVALANAATGTRSDAPLAKSTDLLTINPNATTGWYWLDINGVSTNVWIDTVYRSGGWVLVLCNRRGTGGMTGLTYSNGTSYQVNYRGEYGDGKNLGSFNMCMGLPMWSSIIGDNPGTGQVAQFVSTSSMELGNTGGHSKRQYWNWNGAWTNQYAASGASGEVVELGSPGSGQYDYWTVYGSYGYNFTTTDDDNDTYGGNCANLYNANPWWYNACWSGNMFAGGPYQDAPYWYSSGGDNHNYGAMYVK